MKRACLMLWIALFSLLTIPATGKAEPPKVIESLAQASSDEEFQTQGEYQGVRKGIQVIALGEGNFRAVLFNGGLPGAGWDQSPRQEIEGNSDDMADLTEGLEKVIRQSPTLGAAPPEGSIVLFDGTKETFEKQWNEGARIEPLGENDKFLLREGATSKQAFQDYTLHLEFQLSFMPSARGQKRSNSGAYHQSRYETQILDSFGLEGKDNECGGLYKIKAPDVNMCFPPLSWQTYDVDLTSARFDEKGQKTANARLTVRLNGVVIHNNIELPDVTAGNQLPESAAPGPLFLQNHKDPVRFRNIWIVPRDAAAHARRPIVPGFERFHARADQDPVAGGKLLLGELNCTGCHAAGSAWTSEILHKQGPRLNDIGNRVRHNYLQKFVYSPHDQKPGSTMPAILSGLSDAERREKLEPIVHFLASTGKESHYLIDRVAIKRGEQLFHSVGCTICHGMMKDQSSPAATSVPLGPLHKKYSPTALQEFLKNPHAVRPAGRMPGLHLDDKEAADLAHYLLRDARAEMMRPNVSYQAFHGEWQKLPDFSKLTPVSSGTTAAFSLDVAGREENFGIVFEGWITIPETDRYRFHLGSDDGSRLLIDGIVTVENDGVHAHTAKSATAALTEGPHHIRVEYFELHSYESLAVEVEGRPLPRQDLASLLRITKEELPQENLHEQTAKDRFVFDPEQVELGRKQFAAVGCAACHEMKANDQPLASTLAAPAIDKLNPQAGCLAEQVPAGLPQYDLSREQRIALRAALLSGPGNSPDAPVDQLAGVKSNLPAGLEASVDTAVKSDSHRNDAQLQQVMTTFNCYACHERGGIGGAEIGRNEFFKAKIPEMGDEGRLPPPLNGVADKLQENWLKGVLKNGARDRSYMQVRMPKFNHEDVNQLAELLIEQDQQTAAEIPQLNDTLHRIQASGQDLVSAKALACIKCHTFANYPATGIQAIALTTMHKRLREDWFHRYLNDPQKYRPGTRMPNSFVNGQSAAKEILNGQAGEQISAIWTYLQQGEKGGLPAGLLPDPIELVPDKRPIIYRNFIEGLSPRGIAVGYPEHANIAWDAEDLCLKLIWHGAFIDAGQHWRGRGQGTQRPLGVHALSLDRTIPWAVADEMAESVWPDAAARTRGFRFAGYRLDEQDRPIFLYEHPQFSISEAIEPLARNAQEADLQRTFVITPKSPGKIYFLAARAREITQQADQSLLINNGLKIDLQKNDALSPLQLIDQDGQKLAVYQIDLQQPTTIVQTIRW